MQLANGFPAVGAVGVELETGAEEEPLALEEDECETVEGGGFCADEDDAAPGLRILVKNE